MGNERECLIGRLNRHIIMFTAYQYNRKNIKAITLLMRRLFFQNLPLNWSQYR